MALQFCDGFDSYGSAADFLGKWNGWRYSTAADLAYLPTGGRFGGGAVRFLASSAQLVRKTSAAVDELFLTLAVFPRAYPTSSTGFVWFEDASGSAAGLRMTTGGGLFGTQMGSTSALTPTSAASVVLNQWNTLAIHYRCADSGGRWRVILNGSEAFDVTGDTRLSGGPLIDRVVTGAARAGSGIEWDADDVILCDTSGTALNALLTTDVKIETLRPLADAGSQGWTPSAGTDHFALVDEAALNDADFLAASVTGTRDLFTLAPPASAPQTTHALVVNVRGRRTDVGAKAIRPLVRANGSETVAADLPLSNQTTTLQHPVPRNPDGGGTWTGAALAAAQIGIEAGT